MAKPTNPNINFPQAFAIDGQKTDFLEEKIQDGFDPIDPDVLAGDNLNKFIDDTYKGLHYAMDGVNDLYKGAVLYSSTETYNSTSIVFSISEDRITLYRSLADNNLGNPLTDETKWKIAAFGADTDLSNLTYQGTQRFLSNQQLSNYIKYSPKRVTCRMDADGTFRALAGSTFIIPNGFNEDGSRRFDYVTSTKDSVRDPEKPFGPSYKALWFQSQDNMESGTIALRLSFSFVGFVTSSTQPQTTTGQWLAWFDTTNNRIRAYSGETNNWLNINLSLPFAMTYCDLPTGTTVDFSFTEMNGVHWFGNTVFIDKDVTMLCPNYKDPETGTLSSIEYTTDNVYYGSRAISDYGPYSVDFYFNISTKTVGTYGSAGAGSAFYGAMAGQAQSSSGTLWYNLNDNKFRYAQSGEQAVKDVNFVYIGTFLSDSATESLYPITAVGTTTPLATYNDVYRLPSYYGWYSITYHNTTGTAGYRLYFYDSGFRWLAFGIQWGYLTGGSGTVNLYYPFSSANYHISLTYKASANQGSKCKTATVLSSTASSFRVGYLDSGSVTVQQGVRWVAIGC